MSNTQKSLTVEELRCMHGELIWDDVVKDWGEVRLDLEDSLSGNCGIVLYRNTYGCCGFTHNRFYRSNPNARATFGDWLAWVGFIGIFSLFILLFSYKMKLDGFLPWDGEDLNGLFAWLILFGIALAVIICAVVTFPAGFCLIGSMKQNREAREGSEKIYKVSNILILVCAILQLLLLLFGVIDLLVAKKILAGLVIVSSARNLLLKKGTPLSNLLFALVGVMQFLPKEG